MSSLIPRKTRETVVEDVARADEHIREAFNAISTDFWQAQRVGCTKVSIATNAVRVQLNNISKAIYDLKKDLNI